MRTLIAIAAALATLFFVVFLARTILLGTLGLPVGIVAAIAAFFLVYRMPKAQRAKLPDGFNASFAHDNIAIDQQAGRLWLRDFNAGSAVFDKCDILRWNVAYVANGTVRTSNRLIVHVRDMNRPKFEAYFIRHKDTSAAGAASNAHEADEWASRLTTWINDT